MKQMNYITRLLVLFVAGVLLTGCYSHRVIGLLQEPGKHKIPTYV